jgi:hypothetical protein
MVNRTLHEFPDKKWYVFAEPDTFIFWQTLLVYLSQLDWTKPYYIGGQFLIGDVEFGQGGNGYIISRSALEKVVSHYQAHQREYEDFTEGHWAGDCVLGKALRDSGTSLTRAWPIFQGDDVGNMNYNHQTQWCQATVSYHHVSASVIQDLSLCQDGRQLPFTQEHNRRLTASTEASLPLNMDNKNQPQT